MPPLGDPGLLRVISVSISSLQPPSSQKPAVASGPPKHHSIEIFRIQEPTSASPPWERGTRSELFDERGNPTTAQHGTSVGQNSDFPLKACFCMGPGTAVQKSLAND